MASYKISHLNMQHSCRGATYLSEYCELIPDMDYIISLNEPPIRGEVIQGMQNFDLYYVPDKNIRAAIAIRSIKKNIKGLLFRHLSNKDRVVLEIRVPNRPSFYLISLYLHCNTNIEDDLIQLQHVISLLDGDKPLIIASDTNCRSSLWGDTWCIPSSRANALIDFISFNDLTIKNDFNQPTFISVDGSRTSIVDMIITNQHCSLLNTTCSIRDADTYVDHKHLLLNHTDLTLEDEPFSTTSVRFNTQKVNDWNPFLESLENHINILNDCNFDDISSTQQADYAVKKLNRFLHICCNETLPTVQPHSGRKHTYENLSTSVDTLQQAESFRKQWHSHSRTNVLLANDFRSKYFELIHKYNLDRRKYLNENFKKFCESDSVLKSYKIHNMCKPNNNKIITALPDENGKYANSITQNLSIILNGFSPNSNHPELPVDLDDQLTHFNEINISVDLNTLKAYVFGMKPHKAPGFDGISPIIIQKSFEFLSSYLIKLYTALIRLNYFPKKWKKGIIILIPKPGLDNLNPTIKNFRPITLLPVFGKILERFIVTTMNNYLYTSNQMSLNQYGFVRQTSTIDALLDFKNFITRCLNNKKFCLAISLDISGAFDNACFSTIINNLINKGCPSNIIRMYCSYFSERTVSVNFSDLYMTKNSSQGCPQGSVSGPFLWNILLDSLLQEFHNFNNLGNQSRLQSFADDTALYLEFDLINIHQIFDETNRILDFIYQWGLKNHLQFNPNKTQAIVFTGNKKLLLPLPVIQMNGQVIPIENEIKYLGITFDKNLSFKQHLKNVTTKANKELNYLSIHVRNTWGSTSYVRRLLVNSIIYPKISYAAIVWFQCMKLKTNLKMIRKLSYYCDKKKKLVVYIELPQEQSLQFWVVIYHSNFIS